MPSGRLQVNSLPDDEQTRSHGPAQTLNDSGQKSAYGNRVEDTTPIHRHLKWTALPRCPWIMAFYDPQVSLESISCRGSYGADLTPLRDDAVLFRKEHQVIRQCYDSMDDAHSRLR